MFNNNKKKEREEGREGGRKERIKQVGGQIPYLTSLLVKAKILAGYSTHGLRGRKMFKN